MDEFNNNELFENDNNAIPLEENGETASSSADSEFSSPEEKDIYSSQQTEASEPQPSPEVFQFEENGEYHFTAPMPDETAYSAETEEQQHFEEPHTIDNNQYAQQNPYRNPYQQQNSYSHYRTQQNQNNIYQQPSQGHEPPKKPTKGSSTGKKIVAVLLAVFVILGSVGIGISIGKGKSDASAGVNVTDTGASTSDSATLAIQQTEAQTSNDVDTVSPGIQVAKKARGSVVGVVVYDANGTLYGEGSGVVMGLNDTKDKTYIITCAHVISDSEIKSCGIMLADGKVYPASIIGYDERTDIGVISVEETNLEAAVFGDSTALQVGETVYAIGNPGGSEFYGSMTSGIVSALDRSISSTYTMTVIQHNAAISPGNSGGALVNADGQVVGINSSKISATDYEGIGFAVPISVARPVVENLIKYGYVPDRPKLGISYASVTNYWRYSAIVQSKGLPSGSVIIASISDDSAFNGTDVAVGDMITSVNGKELDSPDVLLDAIDKSKVGDSLKLGICRIERSSNVGGSYKINEFDVTVTLVEDKGSSTDKDQEEETTQSFYDYYYGNGKGDNYNNFEDFFSDFFGN
ncbi:MAG: S1C family serine protease [Acutalibacteraceae bacterium]